eukprot:Gb_12967 [translate_table: standard]
MRCWLLKLQIKGDSNGRDAPNKESREHNLNREAARRPREKREEAETNWDVEEHCSKCVGLKGGRKMERRSPFGRDSTMLVCVIVAVAVIRSRDVCRICTYLGTREFFPKDINVILKTRCLWPPGLQYHEAKSGLQIEEGMEAQSLMKDLCWFAHEKGCTLIATERFEQGHCQRGFKERCHWRQRYCGDEIGEESYHRSKESKDCRDDKLLNKRLEVIRLGLGRPQQPTRSFFFLGPTVVGKAELAEHLFNDGNQLFELICLNIWSNI